MYSDSSKKSGQQEKFDQLSLDCIRETIMVSLCGALFRELYENGAGDAKVCVSFDKNSVDDELGGVTVFVDILTQMIDYTRPLMSSLHYWGFEPIAEDKTPTIRSAISVDGDTYVISLALFLSDKD